MKKRIRLNEKNLRKLIRNVICEAKRYMPLDEPSKWTKDYGTDPKTQELGIEFNKYSDMDVMGPDTYGGDSFDTIPGGEFFDYDDNEEQDLENYYRRREEESDLNDYEFDDDDLDVDDLDDDYDDDEEISQSYGQVDESRLDKIIKRVLKETELGYDVDNFSGRYSMGTRYNIYVDGCLYMSNLSDIDVDAIYDRLNRMGYENIEIKER